jgi:hypothetical protein
MGADTLALFASHPDAIVDWTTINDSTQKFMESCGGRRVDESKTTLKDFMDGLPKNLSLSPTSDRLYHWSLFLTAVSNSNPTLSRIELHFLSEYDRVVTFAIDDSVAWYNVYNETTTTSKFFSNNRRWFRPPINDNIGDEKVFDVKKYKKVQPSLLFDESTRFDTLYSREVERSEKTWRGIQYVLSYMYAH